MTNRVLVKPVEGRLVRIPGTYEALPVDGKPLELTSYWIRKEAAGDVVLVTEQPAGQAPNPKGEKQ
ncbi:DUF2635 domain-containing protein [Pseudomonas sp. GD03860]|uniref:DUF2635 domain-containing protein n=1 Tax=Pseudomonas sp. GD03860 TaxID=2975389 RepID=UPI002446AEF7|nr:DUF2635 domain-containing protein [Pseudomonas sp. GD03860]MDH0640620.1 DUF2635 domain-containing protein [Pseudomonas sp. GD03860]